jgi:hypothetical protein
VVEDEEERRAAAMRTAQRRASGRGDMGGGGGGGPDLVRVPLPAPGSGRRASRKIGSQGWKSSWKKNKDVVWTGWAENRTVLNLLAHAHPSPGGTGK